MGENKQVECGTHGSTRPAFVCQHLIGGRRVGWHEPVENNVDPEDQFSGCINAWCDSCEKARVKYGGWNDQSESLAKVTMVCEECALKYKAINQA